MTPDGLHHLVPEQQVLQNPGPAQVDVAVTEPQSLVDIYVVLGEERWRASGSEDLEVVDGDLHPSGGQVGVDPLGRPGHDGAARPHDVFATELLSLVVEG